MLISSFLLNRVFKSCILSYCFSSPPNLENLYGYQDKLKELKNNLSEFSKVNVYVCNFS